MTRPRIPQVRPTLDGREAEAAARTIRDNWITEGPASREFARQLNALIDVPYGVFAPNGTLALALGLMALGIGPGDEVIVPNMTFVGSATSVLLAGGTPVFVDVDGETFQIDVTAAERAVTERTRAIMPVHLYGSACDMRAVSACAARHGLKIIEDAAQGIGVTFDGRPVGGLGDVDCFSFFADKTLTTGEGGYVTCRDPAIHDRLLLLRNQGRRDRGSFVHPAIGYNFRITDVQAAIGLIQLTKLPSIIERKQRIWQAYRRRFASAAGLRVLAPIAGSNYVPFRCVVITEHAPELARHLETCGIETRAVFYPLHRQPCFEALRDHEPARFDDRQYPNSIGGAEQGLCLPVYPDLSDEEVDYVADAVLDFIAQQ